MPASVHEISRSPSPVELQPFVTLPTASSLRCDAASSRAFSPSPAPSDIFEGNGFAAPSPLRGRSRRAPSSADTIDLSVPPRRSLTGWIWSNRTLGAVCGLAAGAAAVALAPALMPTATLLYNQAILGAASFVLVGGAVTYDARLPVYVLAAAMGAVVGAGLAVHVAACVSTAGLVGAACIGALVGLQVLQHRRAIAYALLATLAVGATYWAALVVCEKLEISIAGSVARTK